MTQLVTVTKLPATQFGTIGQNVSFNITVTTDDIAINNISLNEIFTPTSLFIISGFSIDSTVITSSGALPVQGDAEFDAEAANGFYPTLTLGPNEQLNIISTITIGSDTLIGPYQNIVTIGYDEVESGMHGSVSASSKLIVTKLNVIHVSQLNDPNRPSVNFSVTIPSLLQIPETADQVKIVLYGGGGGGQGGTSSLSNRAAGGGGGSGRKTQFILDKGIDYQSGDFIHVSQVGAGGAGGNPRFFDQDGGERGGDGGSTQVFLVQLETLINLKTMIVSGGQGGGDPAKFSGEGGDGGCGGGGGGGVESNSPDGGQGQFANGEEGESCQEGSNGGSGGCAATYNGGHGHIVPTLACFPGGGGGGGTGGGHGGRNVVGKSNTPGGDAVVIFGGGGGGGPVTAGGGLKGGSGAPGSVQVTFSRTTPISPT